MTRQENSKALTTDDQSEAPKERRIANPALPPVSQSTGRFKPEKGVHFTGCVLTFNLGTEDQDSTDTWDI